LVLLLAAALALWFTVRRKLARVTGRGPALARAPGFG